MAEDKTNLRELLEEIAKEQGYGGGQVDLKAISSGGANYSSLLYVATITAPSKEDLKVFAKVANMNEALRISNEIGTHGYDTERFFYTELAIAFKYLYDKHGVQESDRLYIPKYYGNKDTPHEETIVLEDLAASGFEDFDRFKPFDWDYASSAVTELAKFHALGIACREENLKVLDKINHIGLKDFFSGENVQRMFVQYAYKMGTEVVKEEYRERMKNFLENNDIYDGMANFWKTSDKACLVFGEYKPNNLMHKQKNKKEVQIVPIDYQTIHFGTMPADLVYFLWSGSDSKFRKHHYEQILEHYYNELGLALRNLHIDIAEVYPRKQYEQELEDTKTIGLFIGLVFICVLTVDPENAPKFEDMSDMFMEPNQLGKERMNEIVEDYARWGII